MRSAIRLAVVVVMAVTSTAALAGGTAMSSYTSAISDANQSDVTPTSTNDTDDQDVGHGSGEPGRSDSSLSSNQDASQDDALRAYNQENFLKQSWMATP